MLRIEIFGDICPLGGQNPFGLTTPVDEYIVGNLECVLTDNPVPIRKAGPVLYAPTSFATTLKEVGFNAVSIANNHIRDCGDEGILSTKTVCQNAGINIFGAGSTMDEAARPYILEQEGQRVVFLSFAEKEFNYVTTGKSGAIFFDPYESLRRISEAKESSDMVIVLYHGGIEHYIYPSPLLKKKCHMMVDAGADIVLCQHSHCIGTRELYNGGEILYGQGNSVFGFRKGNKQWNHGLVAKVELKDGRFSVAYDVLETKEDGNVTWAAESIAKEIKETMNNESVKITDDAFINDQWKEFCRKHRASYLAMLLGFGTNANRLNRLLCNGLVRMLFTRRQLNVSHNIIRCDSHREVLNTILEDFDF